MCNVQVVRAPAGDHAEGVGFNAQPAGPVGYAVLGVHAILGVRRLRCAAEPRLVVQIGGDQHFLLAATGRVNGQADLDGVQLADASVADQLAGNAELGSGALLAAYLEGTFLGADRVTDGTAFHERHRERLLDVDVLAGQRPGDDQLGVPMLRGADGDGINVTVLEQLAVITEGLHCDGFVAPHSLRIGTLDVGFRVLEPFRVEVADGDDAGDVVLEDARHIHVVGDAAAADLADLDLVAGCVCAQDG